MVNFTLQPLYPGYQLDRKRLDELEFQSERSNEEINHCTGEIRAPVVQPLTNNFNWSI